MKKYLFLILISCVLILTAVLVGLSLEPAAYYLENKAGFLQEAVGAPEAVLSQKATDREDRLEVEYVSDQAIVVPLPGARLQEQLELALGAFSFNLEDKRYEAMAKPACPGISLTPELGSQEASQPGEAELQSQPHEPYVIYIWHPSATPQDYTLQVDQEEIQADLSLACATPTENTEVEW